MKSFFLLVAILSCGLVVKAQDETPPYITKSLSGEAITDAKLQTSGGGIMVTGVSGNEARLEVIVKPNNDARLSKEELQQRLDKYYTIDISVNNHQLVAIVKQKNNININWKNAVSVSLKAYLPPNVNTNLESSGGGISLSNINGTQNFRTSGGGITVDNVKGKIAGRSSGGGIKLTNSADDIDMVTSGGGITATACTGKIRLRTSGGGIRMNDLDGDVDAQTSGGGIDADNIKGTLAAGSSGGSVRLTNMLCKLEAETSGGGIDAEMADATKDVKLKNSGGSISLQLPAGKGYNIDLGGNKIKIPLSNFSGDTEEHSIKGTLNGGGASINVHSRSGNVTISFK